MNTVHIPPILRSLTAGVRSIELEVRTVRDVVDQLEDHFPGLRDRLCDGTQLRPGINVSIGPRVYGGALHQPIEQGAEVHFLPAVVGG